MAAITQRQDGRSSYSSVNDGGRDVSIAMSGQPRITVSYAEKWFNFKLVFRMLSSDEKNALDQLFRANESLEMTFTYIHDGFNYAGYFTSEPIITPREGPDSFTVTYSLVARRVV